MTAIEYFLMTTRTCLNNFQENVFLYKI